MEAENMMSNRVNQNHHYIKFTVLLNDYDLSHIYCPKSCIFQNSNLNAQCFKKIITVTFTNWPKFLMGAENMMSNRVNQNHHIY
jgi:hypothetical protein